MLASIGEDLFRAVLQGAPPGTVYALVALGFVLAYKTSGIFNLAFGAQAYVSAVVYFKTHTEWGWPILPSFIVSVVILAPLLGVVLEWLVFRHLRTAAPLAGLVVAIGLTVALPAIVDIVMNFEPKTGQAIEGIVPRGNNVFYDVWDVYSFSRNELAAMVIALTATVGLALLFKFTTVGLRMRAVVESPRMTELNGIPADRVSAGAWALSSFFAGLAGVLIAPRFSTLAAGEFFNIVVVAIAAAAVGYLVSLPRAFLGGLGLGILIALFNTFIPKWSDDYTWLAPIQNNLTPAIPFVVLFGILVFSPKVRQTQRASDPLAGVDPPPASQTHVVPDPRRVLITPTARHGVPRRVRRRAVHPGRRRLDLPRHPGRRAGDRVPVDHGDDRVRRAHLPRPGRVRRDRRVHRLPAGRPLRHAGARQRTHRCVHRRGRRWAAVAAADAAERHLDRHRHARVRLLLQLGHGEVLVGRRIGERRRRHAARAPTAARPVGPRQRQVVPRARHSWC